MTALARRSSTKPRRSCTYCAHRASHVLSNVLRCGVCVCARAPLGEVRDADLLAASLDRLQAPRSAAVPVLSSAPPRPARRGVVRRLAIGRATGSGRAVPLARDLATKPMPAARTTDTRAPRADRPWLDRRRIGAGARRADEAFGRGSGLAPPQPIAGARARSCVQPGRELTAAATECCRRL